MQIIKRCSVFTKKEAWIRGSYTVEAALLIPLLTGVIFMFLILSLYMHDRSVLAACAAELAGKGALKKYETEEHLENWLTGQAEGLADGKLLLLKLTAVSAEVTQNSITVFYEGSSPLLGGLKTREEETARRLNPVNYMRNCRRLEKLTEQEY